MNRNASDILFFSKRVLIVSAFIFFLIILLLFLWQVGHIILAVFGGILFAVFLDGLADFVSQKTGIGHGLSLVLAVIVILGLLTAVFMLSGPRVAEESSHLAQRMQQLFDTIRSYLMTHDWSRKLVIGSESPDKVLPIGGQILGSITAILSVILHILTIIIVIFFVGVYLAVDPGFYARNLIKIIPREKRPRAYEVLISMRTAMRWWLAGRFLAMTIIGILVTIGLLVAGIPLALTLGIIAGLFSFVPFLGAVVSAVPAGVVALAQSPMALVYIIILFTGVHTVESYLITPIIQKRAVFIPPALLIAVQILMGFLAGTLGLLFATPIVVVVIVLIQALYVEDVLGEKVRLMGRHRADL